MKSISFLLDHVEHRERRKQHLLLAGIAGEPLQLHTNVLASDLVPDLLNIEREVESVAIEEAFDDFQIVACG